jgi:8-amino-7-oxononanoate synthase
MNWLDSLQKELLAAEEHGLRRYRRSVAAAPTPEIELEGRRVLQFASNNYLGLATHPRVLGAAKAALEQFGAGAGASPLITGHTAIHAALESAVAAWKGAEAALVYAAGSLANLGCLSALAGPGDQIFLDKRVHATLYDGARLSGAALIRFVHNAVERLDSLLGAARSTGGRRVVVVDAVYSMDGDIAPLPALIEICLRHDAILVVDEAHATGVLGARGHGILEHYGIAGWPPCLVLTGTFSKAVGSQGGFVAGPAELVESLVQRSRAYIYATALAPAAAAAALEALNVIATEPQRLLALRTRQTQLGEGLRALGWVSEASPTPIQPVVLGSAAAALALQRRLFEAGIYVPAIRPPTVPASACRLRFSVSADHSAEQIDRLLHVLGERQ